MPILPPVDARGAMHCQGSALALHHAVGATSLTSHNNKKCIELEIFETLNNYKPYLFFTGKAAYYFYMVPFIGNILSF